MECGASSVAVKRSRQSEAGSHADVSGFRGGVSALVGISLPDYNDRPT